MQELLKATREALNKLKSDSDYYQLSQDEKDFRLEQYVVNIMQGK